jgi:sensor histidine kinase YesM
MLVVIGLGVLMFAIFRYRINTLKKKAEEENLKYQMKNELLQLEQKALRLQMNPHFLFNALNSIQGLIIKNDQKSARYYLAKFAHLMRQILDNSRSGSISLEEEIKSLENYLLIEKLSKKDTFEYIIGVAEDINQSTTQLPPMLIQPFVENAIIHAFTGREDSGEIRIDLSRVGDMLNVSITDNGIGRTAAGEISKAGVNRRSVGIEVTEQRLIAHNEKEEVQSIKITDVVDEDMVAIGTRVELKIRVE